MAMKNREDESEERHCACGEQHEPRPALRLDRPPKIDAAQRDEQKQINRRIGDPAPERDADPVAADCDVVRTRHLVEIGERLPYIHPSMCDQCRARVQIDVHGRFGAGPRYWKNQMTVFGDVAQKADLAGNADLWKDHLRPLDRVTPFQAIEAVGNVEAAKCLWDRLLARTQLSMVEVEHARREQHNERADEQAEIQM